MKKLFTICAALTAFGGLMACANLDDVGVIRAASTSVTRIYDADFTKTGVVATAAATNCGNGSPVDATNFVSGTDAVSVTAGSKRTEADYAALNNESNVAHASYGTIEETTKSALGLSNTAPTGCYDDDGDYIDITRDIALD